MAQAVPVSHERVARESVLLNAGGAVAFAAIVALLAGFFRPQLEGAGLVAAGLAIALVPAGLFLLAFIRADRIEPEPRGMILGVFVLGAILAYGIGQPAIRSFFKVQEWSGGSLWLELAGAILIAGVVQQFLIYAAVRYSVYHSSEFDERVDGIIYGAAAGLGYATAFNVLYVTGNNGVDLAIGALRVVTEALSFACLGGVTGYFIARAKFDKMGPTWLPIGLLIAAVLNGVIDVLLGAAPGLGGGFSFNPWLGLVAAVLIAALIFFLLFRLIERLHRVTEMGVAAPETSAIDKMLIGRGTRDEPEWIVWVVAAVLLIAGALIGREVLGQTRTATAAGMSVTYPARWSRTSEPGASIAVFDRKGGGADGARVSARQVPKADVLVAGGGTILDGATNWTLSRGAELAGYRALNMAAVTVAGREAARVDYAYLLDASSGAMPSLMRATDTLVPCGEKVCVLSFAAPAAEFAGQAGTASDLLAGWIIP